MAITFRGSAQTPGIVGNGLTSQNLFVLENLPSSGVVVNVRRLTAQCDGIAILTAVMPYVRTSRITTAVSGGMIMAKGPFDTTQSSSSGVVLRCAYESTIIATPSTTAWMKPIERAHTAAEQRIGDDQNLLPGLVENQPWRLRWGEKMLVCVNVSVGTSNANTNNNWVVECVWEEDSVDTFAISGVVTLSGTPVVGAEVVVIVADDNALTNSYLHSIQTTIAGGVWTANIPVGKVAYAYAQNDVSGTLYTAEGKPFLKQ